MGVNCWDLGMSRQYNFSSHEAPPSPDPLSAALAIDTGSPVVSVAVSAGGDVVADRATELRRSSGRLLQMIDEVLADAGLRLHQIDLLVGLRGPGSFTGLRVGLATLLGMRMALGTRTATLPTLQVLASLAPDDGSRVTACVDAPRGEWLTQEFSSRPPYSPLNEPSLSSAENLSNSGSGQYVGFGVSRLRAQLQPASSIILVEPGPLAPQALRMLDACPPELNPELLTRPLYLRPPAVTPPSPESD